MLVECLILAAGRPDAPGSGFRPTTSWTTLPRRPAEWADRPSTMTCQTGRSPVTITVLRKFAATARKRMRIEGGGYRRDHLRALAQRVEVAEREVRIRGSKSDLLRTLAAISGVKSATGGVRSSVLDWRRECQPPPNPITSG